MTQRERSTAVWLGALMAGGVTLYVAWSFYTAIVEHEEKIETLTRENTTLEDQIKIVDAGRPILSHWKLMSLGSDVDRARTEYRQFLDDLIRKNGLLLETFPLPQPDTKSTVTLGTKQGSKQPIYTGLVFSFRARCKMLGLAKFLEEFQKAPRMHRIKNLVIERPENISKKEPEMLTISVTTEALIILDADKEKANKKLPEKDLKFVKSEMVEAIGALRRGGFGSSPGLALMGWSASPWGPYLTPLNPPLTPRRNYWDLAEKNMFTADSVDSGPIGTPSPSTDLLTNRMRFNRFIGLTMEEDGKYEARLWDMSTKQAIRIRTNPAFNKIALVQTGPIGVSGQQNTLIRGVVTKIEERKIIMRVALNASDPKNPKWWRYPDDGNFYHLEREDYNKLRDQGRLADANTDKLLLIGAKGWEEYIKREKLTYNSKSKAFQFTTDLSRGYVVYEEPDVVIVQFSGWTSQPFRDPGLAFDRLYPSQDKIYEIQTKHFDALLADYQMQTKLKLKITEEDVDRMFVFHTGYWEWLFGDKLITTSEGGSTFYMYHQFIKGDVISKKGGVVVVRLADKYCRNPGDDGKNIAPAWHEGYCVLRIDQTVDEARLHPLPADEVKKLKAPAGH